MLFCNKPFYGYWRSDLQDNKSLICEHSDFFNICKLVHISAYLIR